MLEYSVYIHATGVALLLGLSKSISLFTSLELHYDEVATNSVSAYFSSYKGEAIIFLFLYLVYVIVAAEIMGAFRIPHQIAGFVSRVAGFPSGKIPLYPQPAPASPEQPVWYEAFHRASDNSQEGRPQVLVRMKSGDWYHGELAAYPILPDGSLTKTSWSPRLDTRGPMHHRKCIASS